MIEEAQLYRTLEVMNARAGAWLQRNKWLLVITQDVEEEMSRLFATRDMEIVIIASDTLVLVSMGLVRTTVSHLCENEKKVEELNAQLVQSDKLAALVKMAAGVAHEINNRWRSSCKRPDGWRTCWPKKTFPAARTPKSFASPFSKSKNTSSGREWWFAECSGLPGKWNRAGRTSTSTRC
jgi:hypothetical protein